jgi:predicted ATPase/DNA-binding SARP family transcriptional activator
VDFRVLGPLEVRVNEGVIPLRVGLPRKLLVALVLRLGERVSIDALADILWSDDPPGDPVNALQILVSHLRKSFSASGEAVTLERVGKGYRLLAPRDTVDAHRVEAVAIRARQVGDAATRLRELEAALAEWRGPPIPEVASEEFAQADLQRLLELRLALMEQRVDALLDLGRHADPAPDLQGLIVDHPLRERFYVQLMTALYRSGRQAEALRVYGNARNTLVEELGLDPSPELQTMEQAVLTHSPALQPSVQPSPATPPPPAGNSEPPLNGWSAAAYPRPLDALIGRQRELARLTDFLTSRRWVTLTGPGGAGKTRLAAELAAQTAGAVWWADLSAADDAQAVLHSIGGATGTATQVGDDGSALAQQLAPRAGLLVLDTCERVRLEVRDVVEQLLRNVPGLTVLATSRQPMGAAAELGWPVPPLSLPHPDASAVEEIAESAAVQLFTQRAANRDPDFRLDGDNCVDVARVCLLLDGLPLAIELASSHAAALDPRSMVRVLDDRLRLLVDDTRGDRQHALRSTIAWSYDLLRPEEAAFFERLAIFAGPFPLEGAIAVAGYGLQRDGPELLLALTRHSLVAVEGGTRYRLLDTIRAFAVERLEARGHEKAAAQQRHASWYADLLAEGAPDGHDHGIEGWRGELRGALPDLRRALEWCFTSNEEELGARLLAELWWLWPREGVFEDASRWFQIAKDVVPAGTPMQAALLASSGTYAVSRGDLGTAAADCRTAAALFERFGDERGLARVLIAWGIALWGQGDYTAAAEAHDRAADLFDGLRDPWGSALALVLRARTALDDADPDLTQRLDQAETAARRSGDEHVVAAALVQRARGEITDGQFDSAIRHAEESLRLNEQHGHREGALGSLHTLGLAWVGHGNYRAAGDAFLRALTTALAMHHAGATAESLDCLAVVSARQERWQDAALTLAAADRLRRDGGIHRSVLTNRFVAEVDAALATRLGPAELQEARREGRSVDLRRLVAEETAKLRQ